MAQKPPPFPRSDLPAPGSGGVPRPAGAPGRLAVLDWAGFRAAVTYTFDDSQPSQVEHYGALQATGVRMTYYVSPELARGHLEHWRRVVADGHEIGNHTLHHCHISRGDDPVLSESSFGALPPGATPDSEIDEATAFITGTLGQSGVWTMASPYADSNWDPHAARRFLANRDAGHALVAPCDDTDPFRLPSWSPGPPGDQGLEPTQAALDRVVDDARAQGRWAIFLLHSLRPTAHEWYGPIDLAELLGNVARVKAVGDVWADSLVNVAAYWRAQKLLAGTSPAVEGSRSTWRWALPRGFPSGKFLRVKVGGGTLTQGGVEVPWDEHGYYEIALDAGELTLRPR